EELDKLWKELPSDDAPKAFRAGADLVALPEQSVSMLRERLKPVAAPPSESIAKHIKDLRSEKFAVRDKARIALDEMKELAEPALRRALEHELPLETRRRVEQILDKLDAAWRSPERVLAVRVVAVLERAGTREARDHLATLAAGAPGAWLTREAGVALERLD